MEGVRAAARRPARAHRARRQGEEEVRALYRQAGRADVGYTIVRPGGLTNGPASPVSALELRCVRVCVRVCVCACVCAWARARARASER